MPPDADYEEPAAVVLAVVAAYITNVHAGLQRPHCPIYLQAKKQLESVAGKFLKQADEMAKRCGC